MGFSQPDPLKTMLGLIPAKNGLFSFNINQISHFYRSLHVGYVGTFGKTPLVRVILRLEKFTVFANIPILPSIQFQDKTSRSCPCTNRIFHQNIARIWSPSRVARRSLQPNVDR